MAEDVEVSGPELARAALKKRLDDLQESLGENAQHAPEIENLRARVRQIDSANVQQESRAIKQTIDEFEGRVEGRVISQSPDNPFTAEYFERTEREANAAEALSGIRQGKDPAAILEKFSVTDRKAIWDSLPEPERIAAHAELSEAQQRELQRVLHDEESTPPVTQRQGARQKLDPYSRAQQNVGNLIDDYVEKGEVNEEEAKIYRDKLIASESKRDRGEVEVVERELKNFVRAKRRVRKAIETPAKKGEQKPVEGLTREETEKLTRFTSLPTSEITPEIEKEMQELLARHEKALKGGKEESGAKLDDATIGNRQRELRELRRKYELPTGEPIEKFNQLARDLKSESDYDAALAYLKGFPPRQEKKSGKDDSKFKGTEGKWKELLDSAPSQRARNKLNAILQRWDNKNGDADKEAAYANWVRSELEGTLSWQDKERAYVRKNIPANESGTDSRGMGGVDVGQKKGRKVSMEKMPDGRMKLITTEADGTVTERIEGDEMKFGEGLEETPPEAWEEYGRRYGEQDREEDESTGDMAHHQEELERWNNRSFPQKIWDWLNRKEPPRPRYAPEVLALLSDRNRTAEERKLIHLVAQATEKHNGIRMRDAADRGEGGRMARIRESLKGGGKAVALATITAATVAVVMSGGTLAAMPILAKVIGAGVGALASTAAKNRVEKVGRAGKVTKFVVPWLIGTMAGVATGAAAGHAIEAMNSYFSSAVPDAPAPPQGAGQAGANAISPSGRSSVLASSLIPAAPPGFDLGDYGYLGNKVILEPGNNIWSQITSGLCDQGLLDPKGRAAFADAFYRTVEDGGFKDLFLSYNNRPLGSGVFWNNLPVGTVGHYDRLLSDPKFVDMLVDRIGDNYPSLLKKINSGGFSAFDFIRGVAYSHGAKV